MTPDIDHPTPSHLTGAIKDAIHAASIARGETVPQWVYDAIREGHKQACIDHDAGRVK